MLKCDYCGREHADDAQACTGCGSPLGEGAKPSDDGAKPAGPDTLDAAFSCAVGLAGLAMGHGPGIGHLLRGLSELEGGEEADSPHSLLEHAALLESEDMRAALAVYEHIAQQYPGTSAAKEASRNAQTIRNAHPEFGSV